MKLQRIVLPSLHLRYSFDFSPFQREEDIGGKWDLHWIRLGFGRDLQIFNTYRKKYFYN